MSAILKIKQNKISSFFGALVKVNINNECMRLETNTLSTSKVILF